MTYKEKIIDAETGNEIFREYTAEQVAEVEAAQAEALAKQIEADAKASELAEKQELRKTLLTKLGISEEEAQLLLS